MYPPQSEINWTSSCNQPLQVAGGDKKKKKTWVEQVHPGFNLRKPENLCKAIQPDEIPVSHIAGRFFFSYFGRKFESASPPG